jgi:hypothetical protein
MAGRVLWMSFARSGCARRSQAGNAQHASQAIAKRRGSSAPEHIHQQQTVISLTLPVQILNQVTVNAANQVIKAGQQELTTVQSGRLPGLVPKIEGAPQKVLSHVANQLPRNETAQAG